MTTLSINRKRNSAFCFALATFFSWGFMFAKHDAALRAIIPFGNDPYDAIGSFAVFVALLLAVIALIRAFRRPPKVFSSAQRIYLIRAQTAVVLVVLITVGADAIAMVRYPVVWIHAAGLVKLIVLLGALALAAAVVQRRIVASERGQRSQPPHWRVVGISATVASAVLVIYPERLIVGVWTHLLTVVVAAVILFATTRAILLALIPDISIDSAVAAPATQGWFGRACRWGVVTLVGAAFGTFAFLGELSEGNGALPMARALALAAVFLGLAIAGVFVAFAFLSAPLGLGAPRRDR